MAFLDFTTDGKKLLLTCDKREAYKAKAVSGYKWNAELKAWEYPLNIDNYTLIRQEFRHLKGSEAVRDWVLEERRKEAEKIERQKANPDSIPLKSELAKKLFPHQRQGVYFMVHGKLVINSDDMGLGKTLQAIAACEELEAKNILVVCPNNLKFNWQDEFMFWVNKESNVWTQRKSDREKFGQDGINIINYEAVWKRQKRKKVPPMLEKLDREWDVIIFDEAHRLKNRKANHTVVCKKLESDNKFLLTGTPIENRPDELFSLLQTLFPKRFTSYWRFVENWCEIDEIPTPQGKTVRVPKGCKNPQGLHRLLKPHMIRRKKEEVLKDLPGKVYKKIPVELYPADRKIYDKLGEEFIAELPDTGEIVIVPSLLALRTRWRQVAISHKLLDTDKSPEKIKSAKIDCLMELLEDNLENHKIVVFSAFRSAIELIASLLKKKGIKYVEYHGGIKEEQRQINKNLFQTDETTRVFLGTIKAAGTGLTLTAADVAIFLDKENNPALNAQAVDRLVRIGQKKLVNIWEITVKNSIEEKIEKMLKSKIEINTAILDG